MHVNYILKFLRNLVDYKFDNNIETLDKEIFEEFFSNYLIENTANIKNHQDEKINCMNKYLEEKKPV